MKQLILVIVKRNADLRLWDHENAERIFTFQRGTMTGTFEDRSERNHTVLRDFKVVPAEMLEQDLGRIAGLNIVEVEGAQFLHPETRQRLLGFVRPKQ